MNRAPQSRRACRERGDQKSHAQHHSERYSVDLVTCKDSATSTSKIHSKPELQTSLKKMSSRIRYGHPPPTLSTVTILPVAILLIIHPLLPLLLPSSLLAPLPPQPSFPALQANLGFSLLAFLGAVWAVPFVGEAFVNKGLRGRDLCKPGGRTSGPWVYVQSIFERH